ncbi:hypothetical protein PDESU_06187 [Pontiella desulfatans]|uniref:Uncharacterized protein n=1 Tax=Pontiella desulfatans TaxID=2750659 RepID=A0A6C2UCF6_PONDE|nr:hypothetical protein [Pontiella desulfatans]VGO17589.1 hypothetical protein PDESU_06187 [Pontiella desulfatans]
MPAIAAVAAVWGAIGTGFGVSVTVGVMLQQAIIAVGIAAITRALGDHFADDQAQDYGAKVNTTSNTAPVVVFYGERVVGGCEYRAASGLENEYLHRVLVLGEGEMESVENIYFNDKDIATYKDSDGNLVYDGLVRSMPIRLTQVGVFGTP